MIPYSRFCLAGYKFGGFGSTGYTINLSGYNFGKSYTHYSNVSLISIAEKLSVMYLSKHPTSPLQDGKFGDPNT